MANLMVVMDGFGFGVPAAASITDRVRFLSSAANNIYTGNGARHAKWPDATNKAETHRQTDGQLQRRTPTPIRRIIAIRRLIYGICRRLTARHITTEEQKENALKRIK